ncbi:metal-dependent hydrolase [Collimonas silvisoli]|uniref:metal-dependent hydrolase n=1 Tax=Collimonas silvisoli TaxID=2825884 RepID=UPI001E648F37|nr:metal-dependent hydrolase [Collimonas silvisoli]
MNTSNPLMVRKLLVDLSQGFPRHWLAGKAFRTQFFNALSMSFPVGEQDLTGTPAQYPGLEQAGRYCRL